MNDINEIHKYRKRCFFWKTYVHCVAPFHIHNAFDTSVSVSQYSCNSLRFASSTAACNQVDNDIFRSGQKYLNIPLHLSRGLFFVGTY